MELAAHALAPRRPARSDYSWGKNKKVFLRLKVSLVPMIYKHGGV